MSTGEGIALVAGVIGLGLMVTAVVALAEWLGRGWTELIEEWPESEDDRLADAYVPGFAAEREAPSYKGRCRCGACRNRAQEPCSDFSGD